MSKKIRISYSSSENVKDYLEKVADQYNMTISGVITMIIMQHKFQSETLSKVEALNSIVEKMGVIDSENTSK